MRIFLFLTFILVQYGCTSVEVAKEVTKASKSIKTTLENITKKNEKEADVDSITEENFSIEKEKEILNVEQKKEKKLVKEQRKITQINFIGKNRKEINSLLGKESLNRIDGNTNIVRFDEGFCRLFLFFNSNNKNSKVEHFEIRDQEGNLIKTKEKIQACYDNFKVG